MENYSSQLEHTKKQRERRSRCIKKERERRSRAFPSDSNPA